MQKIIDEVSSENGEKIIRMIKEAKIDIKSREGTEIFVEICRSGNYEAAVFMIENGVDINAPEAHGSIPIETACDHKQIEIVKLLVKSGINVNYEDAEGSGFTLLMHACWIESFPLVSWLVDNGADINRVSENGNCPLLVACERKKNAICVFLLEKGANPSVTDANGKTPLNIAIRSDNDELAEILIHYGDANSKKRVCENESEQVNKKQKN